MQSDGWCITDFFIFCYFSKTDETILNGIENFVCLCQLAYLNIR